MHIIHNPLIILSIHYAFIPILHILCLSITLHIILPFISPSFHPPIHFLTVQWGGWKAGLVLGFHIVMPGLPFLVSFCSFTFLPSLLGCQPLNLAKASWGPFLKQEPHRAFGPSSHHAFFQRPIPAPLIHTSTHILPSHILSILSLLAHTYTLDCRLCAKWAAPDWINRWKGCRSWIISKAEFLTLGTSIFQMVHPFQYLFFIFTSLKLAATSGGCS